MFVTGNVSFNAYACHDVHFVAKFIWSRTYVPKSSRHEATFHLDDTLQSTHFFIFTIQLWLDFQFNMGMKLVRIE